MPRIHGCRVFRTTDTAARIRILKCLGTGSTREGRARRLFPPSLLWTRRNRRLLCHSLFAILTYPDETNFAELSANVACILWDASDKSVPA